MALSKNQKNDHFKLAIVKSAGIFKKKLSPRFFGGVAVLFSAILISLSIIYSSDLSIALCSLPFILYFGLSNREAPPLYILLLCLPFSNVPVLKHNLLGIPGMKPFNLIAALSFLFLIYHTKSILDKNSYIEKKVFLYFIIYFILFTITVFRSLSYLPTLHYLMPEVFHKSPMNYILSAYISKSLFLIPFIYIIIVIKERENIEKIIKILCFSTLLLSIYALIVFFFNIQIIISNRHEIRELCSHYFGMHYNELATIYISTLPLILYRALKNDFIQKLNFGMSIVVMLSLQSRSGIGVILISLIIFLFLTNKKKELMFFSVLLVIFSVYLLPDFLLKTLSTGVKSGSMDAVFTGRIEFFWIPLLTEWINDPKLFFLGKGRYALMTSPLFSKGHFVYATHAHNAFIDFFLECGFIAFVFLIVFIIKKIRLAWQYGKIIKSPLYWALFTSIIGYIIGGLTERQVFPSNQNMYFISIIALLVNYAASYKHIISMRG